MLAVIALLVTCLIAGSTATKSSGYTNQRSIVPRRISVVPRNQVRSQVIVRGRSHIRRPTRRIIRVIGRGNPHPRYVHSALSYDDDSNGFFGDNSFTSFGTLQGSALATQGNSFHTMGALQGTRQAIHIPGNTISSIGALQGFGHQPAMQGNAYYAANSHLVPTVSAYNVALGNSRFGYLNNAVPQYLNDAGDR